MYGLERIRQTVGTAGYYHADQLGSVTNTTSASGASQRTWSYEPYGVIRTSSGSSPVVHPGSDADAISWMIVVVEGKAAGV